MDTFAIRLAVVRAVMGWNYDQAARATGVGSETWRTWEKGTRRCTDIVGVSARISEGTDGVVSRDWLILGGPLAQEPAPALDLPHRRRPAVSAGPHDLRGGVNERYLAAIIHRPERRSSRDDWRIRELQGSHDLPILARRHGHTLRICRNVAA
jgi:hypothetical protein